MQGRATYLLVIPAATGLTGCRYFGDNSHDGTASGGGAVPPATTNHVPTISGASIAVANAAVVGSATLNWQAPSQNADGTPLTDLAGYGIHHGTNMTTLNQKIAIDNAGITTYVIDNLPAGARRFSLSSVNRSGIESNPTNAVSMPIG